MFMSPNIESLEILGEANKLSVLKAVCNGSRYPTPRILLSPTSLYIQVSFL